MFQLFSLLSPPSVTVLKNHTTQEGLARQYQKDLLELSERQMVFNSMAPYARRSGERNFLLSIARLSRRELFFIDCLIEALIACNDRLVSELIGEYSLAPEELVKIIDFVNIEIRCRGLERAIRLTAVVCGQISQVTLDRPSRAILYCYEGWSDSGSFRPARRYYTGGSSC